MKQILGIVMKQVPALVIGFVLGGIAMACLVAYSVHRAPAAPELRPAKAIKVTLYPWEFMGGVDGKPVEIPPEKLDQVYRRLTPDTYYEGGVCDFITPIVAKAVITHDDGTETSVLVRDGGHNPAVVSLDGRNYFYARSDPDVYAGAYELFQVVGALKNHAAPQP
ncbi:MAG: hypothetical protein AB7K24_19540 [Gemmataceae bacterium]